MMFTKCNVCILLSKKKYGSSSLDTDHVATLGHIIPLPSQNALRWTEIYCFMGSIPNSFITSSVIGRLKYDVRLVL